MTKKLPGVEYADPKLWHDATEKFGAPKEDEIERLCVLVKDAGRQHRPIIMLDNKVLLGRALTIACVREGIAINWLEQYDANTQRHTMLVSDWLRQAHPDYKPPRAKGGKDTREYDEVHDPGKIPAGQFQTIVGDPPWDVSHATAQYPTMPVAAIEAMGEHRPLCPYFNIATDPKAKCKGCGVLQAAAENCHLYLWAINGRLREGLDVMDAWGFRYITQITWNKTLKEGIRADGLVLPNHGGQGVYYRGTTEQILFGVKGHLLARTAKYDTQFYAPRGDGHSVKPDEYFWPMVMRVSPGPYLELFARRLWRELDGSKGDAVWGNQAPRKGKKQ